MFAGEEESSNSYVKTHVRKTQISNDSRLVEGQTLSADGEEGPDEREEPQTAIFEGHQDLAQIEIDLFRSG